MSVRATVRPSLSWFFGNRFELGPDFDLLLRQELRDRLGSLSFVIAGLYGLLTFCHPLFIAEARTAQILSTAALSSSLFSLGVALFIRRFPPLGGGIECLGILLAALLVGNSGLHLYLVGDPLQSTNFLVVVIGVGCVFDHFRDWIICIGLALAAWYVCGPSSIPEGEWSHYGFMLFMASLLSAMLFSVRIRHRVQLELSRRELERKAVSLEASNTALLETERRLNEAQEIAQVGSWQYVLGSKELWLSPEVYRILGCQPTEGPVDWPACKALICPEDRDRVREELIRLRESQGQIEIEFEVVRKAGDRKVLFFRGHSSVGNSPEVVRLSGTIQDVTDQKAQQLERERLEHQLRSAQRMDALGTMAGGIAHDFNNILFSILGNAQLAELDVPEGHPARRSLTNIVTASKRARDVVRQILTFSQRQEVSIEETQLSHVVGEVLELLRASMPPSIEIRTDFEPDCPAIAGDQSQIHQILVNLCSNALDAMKETGGVLKISVKNVWPDSLSTQLLSELATDAIVGLRIEDSGVGMGEATAERIFEPFFTTKTSSGGTGLGLAVVHGIVKSHGGAITVHSRLGHGTVFDLYFPVIRKDSPTIVQAAKEIRKGHGERVLLVDDEVPVLRAVSALLDRLGYRVTECTNPLDCERLFKRYPGRFDIIVTDLRMREMLGTELARRLSQRSPGIPIILVTGHAEQLKQEDLVAFGISCLLQKPSTLEVLAACMSDALEKKGGRNTESDVSPIEVAS